MLTVGYQQQNGLLYYNKFMSIPRGYADDDEAGDLDLRKNLLMSLEYYFPILYTDRGLGLMLYHVDLVKGSLFADCGAGWNGSFDVVSWTEKTRTTVGASLTTRSSILGNPLELGMAVGYKIRERECFSNLILEMLL
jgi:outer membrane protein assembly factor BamA